MKQPLHHLFLLFTLNTIAVAGSTPVDPSTPNTDPTLEDSTLTSSTDTELSHQQGAPSFELKKNLKKTGLILGGVGLICLIAFGLYSIHFVRKFRAANRSEEEKLLSMFEILKRHLLPKKLFGYEGWIQICIEEHSQDKNKKTMWFSRELKSNEESVFDLINTCNEDSISDDLTCKVYISTRKMSHDQLETKIENFQPLSEKKNAVLGNILFGIYLKKEQIPSNKVEDEDEDEDNEDKKKKQQQKQQQKIHALLNKTSTHYIYYTLEKKNDDNDE